MVNADQFQLRTAVVVHKPLVVRLNYLGLFRRELKHNSEPEIPRRTIWEMEEFPGRSALPLLLIKPNADGWETYLNRLPLLKKIPLGYSKAKGRITFVLDGLLYVVADAPWRDREVCSHRPEPMCSRLSTALPANVQYWSPQVLTTF